MNSASFWQLLETHFEHVQQRHMQGLAILNPRLAVEVVGVRELDTHQVCVLITPWFMNLVIRSTTDHWGDSEQGDLVSIDLPGETLDFTVSDVDGIGRILTAVLFRSMVDFPDQKTAREIAAEIMQRLFVCPQSTERKRLSRRSLLTGLEAT